jgi:signal peptidase II
MRNLPGQTRWLWISLVVIALDQWSKAAVLASFRLYERLEILPFFNLTLAFNRGAAFSFLAGESGWQRWFFTGVAVIVSVVILVWLARAQAHEKLLGVALSLVLGGAIGNLWDRLQYGHVVDFLDFHWAGWHFPAFNVADSAITVGAALMILDMFLSKRDDG